MATINNNTEVTRMVSGMHTITDRIDNEIECVNKEIRDVRKTMVVNHTRLFKFVNSKNKSFVLRMKDLEKSFNEKISKERQNYKEELSEMCYQINARFDKLTDDIKDNHYKKIRCQIYRALRFLSWELYIDGEFIGRYFFRFTARRAAIKYVNKMRRETDIRCDYDGSVEIESFVL